MKLSEIEKGWATEADVGRWIAMRKDRQALAIGFTQEDARSQAVEMLTRFGPLEEEIIVERIEA